MSGASSFPLFEVPYDLRRVTEQMGTKPKFWYQDAALGTRCLFKQTRPGHGEDWAEKVAQECAALLGIPYARYELAVCADPERGTQYGVISPSFVEDGETMIHGNELLAGVHSAYAETAGGTRATRSTQYTVELVLQTIEVSAAVLPASWQLPPDVRTAGDVIVGFLLVDAWVGNTDRHEENWAVIDARPSANEESPGRVLAPYYDSASCLGRNEPDDKRTRRILSRDARDTVEAYAARAKSAFFATPNAAERLAPIDAFARSAALRTSAALAWLGRLADVGGDEIDALLARLPVDRVSEPARTFAGRMLHYNRTRLLDLRADLDALRVRPEETQ